MLKPWIRFARSPPDSNNSTRAYQDVRPSRLGSRYQLCNLFNTLILDMLSARPPCSSCIHAIPRDKPRRYRWRRLLRQFCRHPLRCNRPLLRHQPLHTHSACPSVPPNPYISILLSISGLAKIAFCPVTLNFGPSCVAVQPRVS